MILLPYRFCGDNYHAFAFPFVLIFLPLRLSCKESSTSNQAFLNSLYDPFGSPCRGQKPQEEGCNRPTRCSEPLRYKVGGASKPSPGFAGWDRQAVMGSACNYIAESGCMERVSSIDAMKLSISVFFLDYSLSFFISSAGFSTNFCSAWLAVGAMRLFPP